MQMKLSSLYFLVLLPYLKTKKPPAGTELFLAEDGLTAVPPRVKAKTAFT